MKSLALTAPSALAFHSADAFTTQESERGNKMINLELEKVPTEEYFSVVEQPRLRQDN